MTFRKICDVKRNPVWIVDCVCNVGLVERWQKHPKGQTILKSIVCLNYYYFFLNQDWNEIKMGGNKVIRKIYS